MLQKKESVLKGGWSWIRFHLHGYTRVNVSEKVVLYEERSLVRRLLTWTYEGKWFGKRGVKRGVVLCQRLVYMKIWKERSRSNGLKRGIVLVKIGLIFHWNLDGKVSEKEVVLKEEWVCHQGGLWSGVLWYSSSLPINELLTSVLSCVPPSESTGNSSVNSCMIFTTVKTPSKRPCLLGMIPFLLCTVWSSYCSSRRVYDHNSCDQQKARRIFTHERRPVCY